MGADGGRVALASLPIPGPSSPPSRVNGPDWAPASTRFRWLPFVIVSHVCRACRGWDRAGAAMVWTGLALPRRSMPGGVNRAAGHQGLGPGLLCPRQLRTDPAGSLGGGFQKAIPRCGIRLRVRAEMLRVCRLQPCHFLGEGGTVHSDSWRLSGSKTRGCVLTCVCTSLGGC